VALSRKQLNDALVGHLEAVTMLAQRRERMSDDQLLAATRRLADDLKRATDARPPVDADADLSAAIAAKKSGRRVIDSSAAVTKHREEQQRRVEKSGTIWPNDLSAALAARKRGS
jgi:hypothetical protein